MKLHGNTGVDLELFEVYFYLKIKWLKSLMWGGRYLLAPVILVSENGSYL